MIRRFLFGWLSVPHVLERTPDHLLFHVRGFI